VCVVVVLFAVKPSSRVRSPACRKKRPLPEADEEEEVETAAEKRLRMAKGLIARAEAHGV
jgi:hypothetical protein